MLHPTIAAGNLPPALSDVTVSDFRSTGLADELPGFVEWHAVTHGHWPGDQDDLYFESECRRDQFRRHVLALNVLALNVAAKPQPAKPASAEKLVICPVALKPRDKHSSTLQIRSPRTGKVLTFNTFNRPSLPDRTVERIVVAAAKGEHTAAFTKDELLAIVKFCEQRDSFYAPLRHPTIHGVKRRWKRR